MFFSLSVGGTLKKGNISEQQLTHSGNVYVDNTRLKSIDKKSVNAASSAPNAQRKAKYNCDRKAPRPFYFPNS